MTIQSGDNLHKVRDAIHSFAKDYKHDPKYVMVCERSSDEIGEMYGLKVRVNDIVPMGEVWIVPSDHYYNDSTKTWGQGIRDVKAIIKLDRP